MKLVDLRKEYEGKYLSYYVASFINNEGHVKEYEFISRDKNLTIEKFGRVNNFPAGLIDPGEKPEETARRELKEETGLDLVDIIDVLPPSFASQGTSDEMMVIVIATVKGEIKNSSFADEEIEAKWFTKDEVRELIKNGAFMSVRTQMFLYQWINEKD